MTSWTIFLSALERGGVIFPFSVLNLLPVCGFDVGAWLVLRPFGWWMVKTGDLGREVPEHGDIHFSSNVVQIKVDAQLFCARPIMQDGVVRGQAAHEVFGMLLANISDAEIVNAKVERYGPPLVLPKSWSEF